jgi:hypothetical protein
MPFVEWRMSIVLDFVLVRRGDEISKDQVMSPWKTFAALGLICSWICSGTTAQAAATCINVDQIQNSDSPDGKTLILKMKNGKVWQSTLKGNCSGIRFYGFSWNAYGGRVCDDGQIVRIPQTGQICGVGKFVAGDPKTR